MDFSTPGGRLTTGDERGLVLTVFIHFLVLLSGLNEKLQDSIIVIQARVKDVSVRIIIICQYANAGLNSRSYFGLENKLNEAFNKYHKELSNALPASMSNLTPTCSVVPRWKRGPIQTYKSDDQKSILVVAPFVGIRKNEWVLGILFAYAALKSNRYRSNETIREAMTLATVKRLAELLDKILADSTYAKVVEERYGI